MNPPIKYIEEFPNMSYLMELGTPDLDFERKFVAALENEFIVQKTYYLGHIRNNEPRSASEIVRKIKSKFSVLSMNNSYVFAEFHEEKLRTGDMSLNDGFRHILRKVDTYLQTLWQRTNKG